MKSKQSPEITIDLDRGKIVVVALLFLLIFVLPVSIFHNREIFIPQQVNTIRTNNLASSSNEEGRVAGTSSVGAEENNIITPVAILLTIGGTLTLAGGYAMLRSKKLTVYNA